MSFEERNAWSALIGGLLTFAIFGWPIWQGTLGGAYAAPDGLSLWAWDVIWLIGGGIGVMIAVLVAFQTLYAVVTRTSKPQFLTDERDMMINRRGALVTLVIVSAGFLLGIAFLAQGWSALSALNAMLGGMMAGAFAAELYRVAVYRFGF